MSFLMQQRTNAEAIDHLEETSNSAVESLENKLKENETLKQQVAELEAETEQLTEQAAQQAAQSQAELEELESMLQAMTNLNTLRSLYNQGRYSDARDFLTQLEQSGGESTEELLTQYVENYADPEMLEVYHPLEAWQQLTSWLG